MNFETLAQAKTYVREMSVEATEEIGGHQVIEYVDGGDIELVAPGESPTSAALFSVLGRVSEVLY